MRILKHRNLLGCLFAIILAMPLIQVGVRCAYTIFNKNAKDSYSENIDTIDYVSDYENGRTYYFYETAGININSNVIPVRYLDLESNKADIQNYYDNNKRKISYFELRAYGTSYTLLFYDKNQTQLLLQLVNNQEYLYMKFITTQDGQFGVDSIFYTENLNTLDNAFDYSISKITESNNIGDLKFFTWFADIFLDLDNPSNALYINFINWYFNYALLVSAVYILFLALMWFIMWVRKLLERGMDFGNRSW